MIWSFGRAVVWLKRGAIALERIADSQHQQAILAQRTFDMAHPIPSRAIRKAEFGVADVAADWNEKWLEAHPEYAGDE